MDLEYLGTSALCYSHGTDVKCQLQIGCWHLHSVGPLAALQHNFVQSGGLDEGKCGDGETLQVLCDSANGHQNILSRSHGFILVGRKGLRVPVFVHASVITHK